MRQPKLHSWADKCTEILIYFMVIFTPWAFGTTQQWSIWTMNITAYGLGVMLVSKWIIRWSTGFRPWPSEAPNEISLRQHRLRLINKYCNLLTAVLMFLLLGYILTSAINARASFNLETHEYTYFEEINKSLPHSYNERGTWFLFWQYLGLIILFWSTRDWLVSAPRHTRSSSSLNPRLKRLFFLICLNGGALAFESILQRIYYENGQGKLLFLQFKSNNSSNVGIFGPFAYRSNAATYLNLIWPLNLGLLIQMGRENLDFGKKRIGNGAELLLLPCMVLAMSGPFISSARGGMFIMVGLLIITAISMMFLNIRSTFLRYSVSTALFAGLSISYYLGWEKIESRLMSIFSDNMSNRLQIFETAIKMIDEYGFFGSGPGSFEAIAQFELGEKFTTWHSWVHNDYLEFYLTFGKPGGAILLVLGAIFALQFLGTFFGGSARTVKYFCFLIIVGVSIHATLDFPLQVYSILALLTLIIAPISILKNHS